VIIFPLKILRNKVGLQIGLHGRALEMTRDEFTIGVMVKPNYMNVYACFVGLETYKSPSQLQLAFKIYLPNTAILK
jgi:hypothetical protein